MLVEAKIMNTLMQWVVEYAPKIGGALLTLVLGWLLINMSLRTMFRVIEKKQIDASLVSFSRSALSLILKGLLIISVAAMVGIQTTSFVALLGALGLAIGLSLQGSLSNFAGGVLILVFRPFRVNDTIEAQGHLGKVREINIFNSVIVTPDNKTIFIPNAALANNALINFTETKTRRLEVIIGIGYECDIAHAKKIVFQEISQIPQILQDPAPAVGVAALADSSVNLSIRAWVNNEDYLSVMWLLQERVKTAFDKDGISIPFPQREVHVIKKP